jgi:hypothetical protein
MGLFKRENEYEKTVDLEKLSGMIEGYLKEDKWNVQVGNTDKEGKIIQARKDGILRGIFASDRALTIVLSKTPKGTKVEMGVGKWVQNIAVTIVESVLLTGLFLVVDIPEMLWNAEIENKIQKKIDEFVNQM